MSQFSRIAGGFHAWFRKTRVEQELDAELRGFLETAVEDKMRNGSSRPDAIRAARLDLGSVEAVKDRVRDVGWESVLESVRQDVRYGCRMLRRSPVFTATALLILALGIGANTAVFSLINTLMLRMLPVRQPEQLVEFLSLYPGDPRMNFFGWSAYERVRDQNHVFSDVIGVSPVRFQETSEGLDAGTIDGEYVVGSFFPALGVEPAAGRLIGPEDDRLTADATAVAVLSWPFWNRRFNLDPAVLGRRIVLSGVPATVIGVAPRGFFGLQVGVSPDLWVPAAMHSMVQGPTRGAGRQLAMALMARLRPHVSIDQARAEMLVLDRPRVEEIAKASRDPQWLRTRIDVEPAGAGFSPLRDRFARPLLAVMAMVGLLLLIACTNIAGLLLARAAARRREMAMRVALGASRLRVVRQVFTESLLLTVTAALIGVFLAYFAADALARLAPVGDVRLWGHQPFEIHAQPDARVLLFTGGISLLTALLFGMAPAWNALTSAPLSALSETSGVGEPRSRRLFGRGLVVAQVALSMVLLSAAGVFVRQLLNLRNVDLGFQRDSVLLVTLDPSRSGYQRDQLSRLSQDLLERLGAIRGVRSATVSAVTPIEGGAASRFVSVEGFQEKPEDHRRVMLNWIGPRYFATLGTPLVAGRDFQFNDAGRPRVAIVNLATARYYFGDRSPIGNRFTFEGQATPYEIVGVAADAKYADLHESAPRTIYLNAFQDPGATAQHFALRTDVAPTAIVGEVRRAVRDVLRTVPVAKVTTLADQVDASIVPERVIALLAGFFGGLGAALAAVGLYGLLAYTVARRTNEIGVRMALGATEGDVTRMVLKGALGMVCAGLVVGAPIAVWSQRLAASMVENLPAETAAPIAFAALAMMGVGLLAAYVPAWRAARVRPMDALRHS